MSSDDETWIEDTVVAWERMQGKLIGSQTPPKVLALFFDDACVYRADFNARDKGIVRFDATAHHGGVRLPSGSEIPSAVAAFAAPSDTDAVFFVMALPSIWRASGKQFAFDAETFLTAVMVHEMSHVFQFKTYLAQVAKVEGIELLGRAINDDIVQDRFNNDESFKASVDAETELLYSAALLPIAECRSIAERALAMMRARQAAYYVNELRALAMLEDLFLTLEGSGQFAALEWLTDSRGGRLPSAMARRGLGEGVSYWSQRQGLALFLVLDRLSPDWRETVYGNGSRTVLSLLEEALRPEKND